jgi:hypothetical protein
MFSWQDENRRTLYSRNCIIDLGLKHAGKPNQELEDWHEAVLFTGFGDRAPADDEMKDKKAETLAAKREGKKKRQEKALEKGNVQCTQYIARRRKQCEKYFFPQEGVFGCNLHPDADLVKKEEIDPEDESKATGSKSRNSEKKVEEPDSDEDDDLPLNDKSYEEDEESSSDESDMGWHETEKGDDEEENNTSAGKELDLGDNEDLSYARTTPLAKSDNKIVVLVTRDGDKKDN